MRKLTFILVLSVMLMSMMPARAEAPEIMAEKDILPYLERIIDWHRQVGALDASPQFPREQLLKNTAQQSSTRVLNYSFDFARALAEMKEQPPSAAPATETRGQGMARAIVRAEQERLLLQAEIARAPNAAKREALTGELRLKEEHLNLLRAVSQNLKAPLDEDSTLIQKIDRLAETLPETERTHKTGPFIEGAPVQAVAYAPTPTGIWGLLSEIYSLMNAKREIKKLRNDSNTLREQNRERTAVIRDSIQTLLKQGSDLTDRPTASSRKAYEKLLVDFKRLSKVVIVLSKMNMGIEATARDLTEWISLTNQHLKDHFKRILLRTAFLSLAILVVIGLSVIASRATHHYVMDIRLQRHLKIARRIVFSLAVVLILFMSFFTNFSSLATFAGLLTAGLAVAMQNIIMSFFAYFYLFGKFGMKVGDRVSVLGVTGKVIQISMLRFQILEQERSSRGYYPTGRTIGFSNAVLFQPTPFIRETPGTNFLWSKISLKLDTSIDYQSACKKLSDCVMKVYEGHKDIIRQQELALQDVTDFKTEISVPQTYLKITDGGLLLTIRYAVHREHESDLQQQMTEALLALIRQDPELKFVNIG